MMVFFLLLMAIRPIAVLTGSDNILIISVTNEIIPLLAGIYVVA